jgi:hypothetical protein
MPIVLAAAVTALVFGAGLGLLWRRRARFPGRGIPLRFAILVTITPALFFVVYVVFDVALTGDFAPPSPPLVFLLFLLFALFLAFGLQLSIETDRRRRQRVDPTGAARASRRGVPR